ncbi:MAG: Asp-tRNA(Asn)/Glu-tRNA(Gln) amidotransferase subunit GatB [Nanoarchaeota archaeon]|nr:Asp-tRNA(Asn)/Glu-tRNA(Gln) amidotransferase subunit GatB [Nanoarchaeota archaeon]MBU1004614.1 Asp-tRNA(Asn)/Glu-tRNA(Gln) amidotransferase subunit GatB [Nanoarchaeota archaeon]MBU1945522.1 Asp-tRNA(Asn)/Glu-tRNA(Gln) amidotransferase subunit GatB [Nanoarchaeota archaeon]
MKFNSDIVIGLEIHCELATKSKLFCGCARSGSNEPNSRTCPTCLGHPGSKPVLNKKAVEFAIKLALATNSKITKELIFSRKSYFYPDMAKNYQISQYEIPLATEGSIKLGSGKEISLTRIHMEEDPAALVHPSGMRESKFVLVDYNRSGDPLVEVVTNPDMTSPEEARDFMNQLITILQYLEIFDINNCIIKADANISIKESGYIRAEIKNVTGFKDIERALKYEVARQKEEVKEGKTLKQETRAWDSEKGITFSLRTKETEADYGYIVDPDLVKIDLTKEWISEIKKNMPELAHEKLAKFTKQHGLTEEMARIISKDKELAEMFEAVSTAIDPELAAKWIRRELTRVLNYNKKKLNETGIKDIHMIDLLKLIEENKITETTAQRIIEKLVESSFDIKEYVKKQGLEAVSDVRGLEKLCKEAIDEAPKAVEEYSSGKEKALNFVVGIVMKKTKGKAKPDEVNKILKDLIK